MESTMNRRKFAGLSAISLLSMPVMLNTVACTFGSVFSEMLKYIGVGLQGFQAVVDLLAGAGVIPVGSGTGIDLLISLVKAAFADLNAAITAYQAAPSASKASYLGKLSTVLSVLQANIQQFWNDLKIPDAKMASTVQGLLGIILSTLAGFSESLPTPAPTPSALKAASLPNRLSVAPQKRTPSQFKKAFNQELATSGYTQYLIP